MWYLQVSGLTFHKSAIQNVVSDLQKGQIKPGSLFFLEGDHLPSTKKKKPYNAEF